MDANGSTTSATRNFYKHAKALYDANYEDDRVTIVQALVLMRCAWEGPQGKLRTRRHHAINNAYYWTGVAITVAQGSGMHRSFERSQLSRVDKRL
ncbi:MAG: hypothetical protein Q9170_002090 [Blastenia crenularia]